MDSSKINDAWLLQERNNHRNKIKNPEKYYANNLKQLTLDDISKPQRNLSEFMEVN